MGNTVINIFASAVVGIAAALLFQACTISVASDSDTMEKGRFARDFSAVGHDNQPVIMSELLGEGPVVVVFYRGYW